MTPTETNDTIASLVALTARLIDLMGREIELLRAMRPREIEGLQADKASLARSYAEMVHQLSADPARLKALEPVVRDELMRVTERFEAAVAENARALKSASEANARLVRAIVDAAERQLPRAEGYTRAGNASERTVGPRGRPVALAVNRQF